MQRKNNEGKVICPHCLSADIEVAVVRDIINYECDRCGEKWVEIVSRKARRKRYRVFHYWVLKFYRKLIR